jgi:hypothetical protein
MQLTEQDTFKKATADYALDRGSLKFELAEVKNKRDKLYNIAIKQAQLEFENLKQIAEVIQKQAQQIKEKVELTTLIKKAHYNLELVPDTEYWLAVDKNKDTLILCSTGPKDWSAGPPEYYEYLYKVKHLANGLWEKVRQDATTPPAAVPLPPETPLSKA